MSEHWFGDKKLAEKYEKIELRRGNEVVRSFFGSFGGLKETRLTAGLAYIISFSPELFLAFFNFKGRTLNVAVESYHDKNRSDILVTTDLGSGIIEAKIDASDPHAQAKKYRANWRVLLTSYLPPAAQSQSRMKYISWKQLAAKLGEVAKITKNSFQKKLIAEYIKYLEEHGMAKANDTVELYAREINEKTTLELFLRGQFYGCDYEKSTWITEALYFAPHFGNDVSKIYPGIGAGISYVAKIEEVVVVETFADLLRAARAHRGKVWFNKNKHLFSPLKKQWPWPKGQKRYTLWLGKPRLCFNPPIKKKNLQSGSGWLSRRKFSFDELLDGWRK
jgi:hypothetical protein